MLVSTFRRSRDHTPPESAPGRHLQWVIFSILFVATAGCGAPYGYQSGQDAPDLGSIEYRAEEDADGLSSKTNSEGEEYFRATLSAAPPEMQRGETTAPAHRLIIYNASFQIQVANLEEAKKEYLALVKEKGGYLQHQENQMLTCRIPAEYFDTVLEALRNFGAILYESIQAKDVTREYLDLEIRLDNAVKSRDRLLELLKRSDKVTDLLEVEKELKRLTEEIERMKGDLRYLKDRVAYSTLQVTFNAPALQSKPNRRIRSRFSWINRIGVEYVLGNF